MQSAEWGRKRIENRESRSGQHGIPDVADPTRRDVARNVSFVVGKGREP
jgi:hypothetical protein